MFKFKKQTYSEDMFADTRMSFGDHLEDLRTHLWRAIKGFVLIMLAVFVFDGIGLITETRFGIGRPMLDFIISPVKEQLAEFHQRKVNKMLKELDNDPILRVANRPRYFKISTPRLADLPPLNGKPLSFSDLTARAQFQINQAGYALQQRKWNVLKTTALNLKVTVQRLDAATNVPEEARAGLGDWVQQLADEATNLADLADGEKVEKSENALARIQEMLGDKGLDTTVARIDEPLVLAGVLNRVIGLTQGRDTVSTFSVMEAFMAYFKVALMCGLVLGSPWIFIQIWSFIAVGLYPHEKRLVNVYLPFSLLLFLIGVLACQFLVIPKAVGALLWFNEWLDMNPDLRFNEWLSFAILMPLVFGISFQLPLVMMFLERLGIMTVQMYYSYWKIAFFLIHVVAAVLMPSPDPMSMECLALPMFGLYGLGILLCRLNPGKSEQDQDVPQSEEMVEV